MENRFDVLVEEHAKSGNLALASISHSDPFFLGPMVQHGTEHLRYAESFFPGLGGPELG